MQRCSQKASACAHGARTLPSLLIASCVSLTSLTAITVQAQTQPQIVAPGAMPVTNSRSASSDDGKLSVTDTRTEVPTDLRPVRQLSLQSLRGRAAFGQPPELRIDGEDMRLAPGARIRDEQNLLVLSGQLAGRTLAVNYTTDSFGLVRDVWLLRPDELDKPWPRTREQATTWRFDPLQQTWIKP